MPSYFYTGYCSADAPVKVAALLKRMAKVTWERNRLTANVALSSPVSAAVFSQGAGVFQFSTEIQYDRSGILSPGNWTDMKAKYLKSCPALFRSTKETHQIANMASAMLIGLDGKSPVRFFAVAPDNTVLCKTMMMLAKAYKIPVLDTTNRDHILKLAKLADL